jgi:cullin-associated NEDD8-dissociated protein 1
MPSRPWLRKGAVWEFRENPQSLLAKQESMWEVQYEGDEPWHFRMILDPNTSKLYEKLCNYNNQTGECQFDSTVVLDDDVPCDGSCSPGQHTWDNPSWQKTPTMPCECSIDEPRTVRLDHSTTIGEPSRFYSTKVAC